MLERFWNQMLDYKYEAYCYYHYSQRDKLYQNILSGLCIVASLGSVSTWLLWQQFPVVWALIVAFAQIISALQPLFPFSMRLTASKYILQDLEAMLIDMERDFGYCGKGISDSEFSELIAKYKKLHAATLLRFCSEIEFPRKAKLSMKAEADLTQYCKIHYKTGE